MPKPVDRCVRDLLANSKFKPNVAKKDRESSAWAICTASHNKAQKKNADATENDVDETLFDMLAELPEDVGISIDKDGKITLEEIKIESDEKFDEKPEDQEVDYDLYFDENKIGDKLNNYSILQEIKFDNELACKTKKKKEKDELEEEEHTSSYVPAVTKLELLREGNFKHPWYGPIVFDKKYFMKAIQNFANDVLHREISFDAQHTPMFGAISWLKTLGLRRRVFNDNKKRWVLTGVSEFTKEGEEMIRSKRFKYFSIEVNDNYIDKETDEEYGPAVMGGGVTNRPFIPGMQAVELSENVWNTDSVESNGIDEQTFEETQQEIRMDSELSETITNLDRYIKEKNISLQAEQKARPPDSQLPDAAFALVKKDRSGKALKRALPHHSSGVKSASENGSVDIGRLRNALARWNQVMGFARVEMNTARAHLMKHADALLKTHQQQKVASDPKQQGVVEMDIEAKIKELQTKLGTLDDQNSEIGKMYAEQIKLLKETQQNMEAKTAELSAEQSKKFAEQEASLKKLQEQNETLNKRFAEVDEERRQANIQLFCERMEKADHFPATIETAKKFLLSDQGNATIKVFDEKKVEQPYTLMKMFEELMESVPSDRRVVLSTTLKGESRETPEVGSDQPVVKLEDGKEVKVFDNDRIKRSTTKAGFKTNLPQ